MSMRDYAFSEVGILLNGLVHEDVLSELSDDEVCESQFSFNGEAFPIRDDGTEDWGHGDSFTDKTVYYIAVPRHPTLFKAAYADMAELVTVMLAQYEAARRSDNRLPELTAAQVRERLRFMQGTYNG